MTRREWLAAVAAWSASASAPDRARASAPASTSARAGAPAAGASAPAGADDPTSLSIAELEVAFASGQLTPLEVTAAYLKRIDAENGALGAYVTVARDRATEETRRLLRGTGGTFTRGALMGVPVAHKDLFRTRGVRTTAGSRLYEHDVPRDDADVVARLTAAGAVLLGKTNTHELGGGVTTINPFFGTTHNPVDHSRIAGGSSGGSAAAVAGGLALVATGSDTGGSVRIPAALCGCVGLKPSFGLLPTTGLLGACPTFDHVGLLTRSMDDAALTLAAITPARGGGGRGLAGEAFLAVYRSTLARGVSGLRVGVPRAYFFENLDRGVATAVERAIDSLRAAGARVRDHALFIHAAHYDQMFDPIAVSEIRATYARAWRARPDAFSNDFAAVFAGPGPTPTAVATAREARDAFQRSVEGVLAEVDVLVMPTVPVVAPRIDGAIDGMRILRNTWPFNAAQVPAVS
ncbi:MAG: amidase, partial [Acidobacteriota bacterium]